MSVSQGLRWSARQISNGRPRLTGFRPQEVRYFSVNASRSSLSSLRTFRGANSARSCLTQQSRSISLFGWGADKSSSDAAAAATSSESTSETTQKLFEPTRTVKATHGTADAPDPTFRHPHPVSDVEPEALRNLENQILKPHGPTPASELAGETPDLAAIPEDIGYLKDVCGLDFGWGPTSILEFCLEHLHITAGLSWSASIVAMAVLMRSAIFPAAAGAAEQGTRMKLVQPAVTEIRARMQEGLRDNNKQAAMEASQQIRELHKEYGVSLPKAFIPILLQIPLQFGAFRLLRDAAAVPVPAFESQQWLWVNDLSVADPTYVLPVAVGALTYFNMVATSKQQANPPPLLKALQKVLPFISFGFLSFQSAAVQIFFLVNGIFTQAQITAINNPGFRRWRGMTPLPPRGSPSGPSANSTPFSKMNLGQAAPKASVAATTEPLSSGERSFIDKGVDTVKAQGKQVWNNAFGDVGAAWKKKAQEKQEQAKLESKKTTAAKYEAQRRQDLEQERSYRNAAAGTVRIKRGSSAPLASRERQSE
ncbi:hypothetical protein PV05_06299 [Exophiala xenobiotica]|uniref:Membrane insertase YidC/Oxa/ALB C-terminal domain-containing protein n=1 Tax=Exophiala xenobiotica TaxID=348802 RepID=A0A0D2EH12_9EURO|nr:uncharacterized protein PV05_06299 [Exophiala xenobiotica]KIW53890.1 hypothetical protein PV05_06299 [Exophiala xenobiotica]